MKSLAFVIFVSFLSLGDSVILPDQPRGKQLGAIDFQLQLANPINDDTHILYKLKVEETVYLLYEHKSSEGISRFVPSFYSHFFNFTDPLNFRLMLLDYLFLNRSKIIVDIAGTQYASGEIVITLEELTAQEKQDFYQSDEFDFVRFKPGEDLVVTNLLDRQFDVANIQKYYYYYQKDTADHFIDLPTKDSFDFNNVHVDNNGDEITIKSPDHFILGKSFGFLYGTQTETVKLYGFVVKAVDLLGIDTCNQYGIVWKELTPIKLKAYTITIVDGLFSALDTVYCSADDAQCTIHAQGRNIFKSGTYHKTSFVENFQRTFKYTILAYVELFGNIFVLDTDVIEFDYDDECTDEVTTEAPTTTKREETTTHVPTTTEEPTTITITTEEESTTTELSTTEVTEESTTADTDTTTPIPVTTAKEPSRKLLIILLSIGAVLLVIVLIFVGLRIRAKYATKN